MALSEGVRAASTADSTPLPINVSEMVVPCALPSSAQVLQWVASAGDQPWFPSQFAAENSLDRDSLDDPLAELRAAELVRVVTWVRGVGQGYALTPEGEAAATRSTAPDDGPMDSDAPRGGSAASELGLDQRLPLIVALLLVANVLWFFVSVVVAVRNGRSLGTFLASGDGYVLHRSGAVSGIDLFNDGWARLLTSCFVHGNALHLISNVVGLALIGPLAELLWGRGRLAVIYIISGLAGSCLAMALRPEATLVGASGAIWGVLTATLAWFVIFRDRLAPDVASDALRRLLIAIALNAGVSFVPGVSWEGHLGGALAGFATAGLLHVARFGGHRAGAAATIAVLTLPVLCVGGLAAMMKWGTTWAALRHSEDQRRLLDAEFRANEARRAELDAALAPFQHDVAPLVNQLRPDAPEQLARTGTFGPGAGFEAERQAAFLLVRTPDRRAPASVLLLRKQIGELRSVADAALVHLAAPTGVASADEFLAEVKAFVEARSRSLALTLPLLDAKDSPNAEAWAAWRDAGRDAARRWQSIGQQLIRRR